MQQEISNVPPLGKKRLRILVVEKDARQAADLGARLERFGYLVCDIVGTAQEAIASGRRYQPDLILMDSHLEEGANGVKMVEYIGRALDVPIIFHFSATYGLVYHPGGIASRRPAWRAQGR